MNNYRLVINLNAKTVKLLSSEGESPLYSLDESGNIEVFGFDLYREIRI